ncbi:uncharacterized protein PHACADRAFT_141576 [Phanerochaete carnosa HHB-10118-sp]|uniref:AAA+ ATPase domain-containing protein n=1 Tax=Phanerochaete carnosa (strain HHB-10118-sp) TaxID=650164 RepID=K5V2F2_PHACS|nr:uncharacterized protein PHACADRAFT_141576 [Phanerochaete carnosa HHB-10118-sp]EKM56706.1 hypothetical protein PHACADRAFT_141576 [Phanerochaete carnosa HHB-10118-sp]
MKQVPCVYNDALRHSRILHSNNLRPAGTRFAAPHPSFSTDLYLSCMQRAYRTLSTSTGSFHLASSSTGMTRTPGAHAPNGILHRHNSQAPVQRARTYSQSQSRRASVYRTSIHGSSTSATVHLSWLFRSNVSPRRSGMRLSGDVQKRYFSGIGEIISVLANPSETLRSLAESKRMLEETRRELAEARERAQLSPAHTFSPLPNFYRRPAEMKAIESALQGDPSFTVLFGASSVGKTALLRQVLTSDRYYVLHFDLRIAGFADLASLYLSLSQQMESFFMEISKDPGHEEFEKQAWGFKHDRLNVERRITNSSPQDGISAGVLGDIKVSDVARLMELYQSSLLHYRNFKPDPESVRKEKKKREESSQPSRPAMPERRPSRMRFSWLRPKSKQPVQLSASHGGRSVQIEETKPNGDAAKDTEQPAKKMPVLFIDEAHKLPALIRSTDAMKCLLDAMLVLTKQDRLCHVIHATSDPFYQTWLRQLNVMQHCKIITVGDYTKHETRRYFREVILPNVPEHLRSGLDFERLYDAFGGKIAHWQDFTTDYVNANGKLDIKQSSHFLQAHSLLNLHVIHAAQAPPPSDDDAGPKSPRSPVPPGNGSGNPLQRTPSNQPLSTGTGFRIYSPLTLNVDPHQSPSSFTPAGVGSDSMAEFTAIQLLKVMDRLVQPGTRALSYFHLCREMGARAVDGMVRGRILDLRWTDPVSKEGWDPRVLSMRPRESLHPGRVTGAGSSGTMVNEVPLAAEVDEEMMTALTDEEFMREEQRVYELRAVEEEEEIVGPKLVSTTPIMRFAMREVVQEYYEDDDRTVSEYASLSEVEEY